MAAVDLKINPDTKNEPLIIAMVIVTSLLVAITMVVKFMASNILPSIQFIAELDGLEEIHRSPHEHLIYFINIAWIFANIICPCLFAIDLGLLCWLQFELIAFEAALAATGIIIILVIVFLIFGIIFLKQKIPYKRKRNQHLKDIVQLTQAITGLNYGNVGNYGTFKKRTSGSDISTSGRMVSQGSNDKDNEELYSLTSSCDASDIFSSSTSSYLSFDNDEEASTSNLTSSIYVESETDIKNNMLRGKRNRYYGSISKSEDVGLGTFNPAVYFYSSN